MARKRRRKGSDIAGAAQIPGIEPVEIPTPQVVLDKVRQFAEHSETYESTDYSEAQLRIDFLNPLLEALGWDVNNKNGYAEAYRDVVYEDALKVGGSTKAPDYGFYIGGRAAGGGRKFFLEAKKPSVAVRVDPKSAFQLRRYAYTAGLPLSILTNFKEFLVFDTRIKPRPKDSASAGVILRVPYVEYPTRWNEIASIFARESILKGSFDKYAQAKRKKGVVPIGESFLADIEEWREALAKEIAASNPEIRVDELNFAVQRTIDRILFLRICEDRGIEPTGNLLGVTNGEHVYERLGQVFLGADDRYNSGIFHFPPTGRKPDPDRTEPPDDLTLGLAISDKPLRKIIRSLYDTESDSALYEFAVMPPAILGQVYEQFLGKVISLTPAHRVKIEEKPEVRKAGGVYYTPAYIVDYIVQETVGKLLEGKSPKDAAKIRVLDPASGSGSFLIGAYQFLLDWHLRWYLENDPESHTKGRDPALVRVHSPSFAEERDAAPRGRDGTYDYRLSTAKRKEILLNSIYGVDIDAQAVEVTKLSLLLKVLEGESQESVNAQLKMFHQRALPDLGRNIKCGNSLISDDFDDSELSEEERAKVNKFNWQKEFPSIFKAGGFDSVIGNPPYLSYSGRQAVSIPPYERRYYDEHFIATGWVTAHGLFIEKSFGSLTKRMLGFIVPDQVGHLDGYSAIRSLLSSSLVSVRYWGERVFVGVTTPALTFVADKSWKGVAQIVPFTGTKVASSLSGGEEWVTATRSPLVERLLAATHATLGDSVADPGVHTGNCSKQLITNHPTDGDRYLPVLEGKQVNRYVCDEPAKTLDIKYEAKDDEYFTIRKIEKYTSARFVIRQTASYPIVGPRRHADYFRNSLLALYEPKDGTNVLYIVGILNSKLMRFIYCQMVHESQQKAFPQVKVRALRALPFPALDLSDAAQRMKHDRLVGLVCRMLDTQRRLSRARTPSDKQRLAREVQQGDRQIDELVYEIYGLEDSELATVEEATRGTS